MLMKQMATPHFNVQTHAETLNGFSYFCWINYTSL